MSAPLLRELGDAEFRARYGCSRFDATVLGNRFAYILEHFCSKLLACAFSPVLRDFYDFAATLTGPPERGYPTPAVSKSFVAFTGTMTEAVRNTIEEYGADRLEPGDVIIGNDPYRIGTHVNDVLFIRPVFHGGRLSGFVNLKCHQLDMGGSVPGGFSASKTSVYENGLVLSPRALVKAGRPVNETWTLIFDNVRFGELLRRDMQTIIACLDLGERLLKESFDRHGRDAVLGAMDYVCDADAERMSQALSRLPDGDWSGEALLDCDGLDDSEEYPVRCTLRKRGARLDGPFTSGCYRPVDILVPDGAVCAALPPEGVVFAYGESTNALLAAMFQALAGPLGEGAVGGDTGAPNLHSAFGVGARGPWISIGIAGGERGPWGGSSAGDGDSYSISMQANSIDPSIESAEVDQPLVILRREYLPDTAGAGRHRGGAAVLKDTLWREPAEHPVHAALQEGHGRGRERRARRRAGRRVARSAAGRHVAGGRVVAGRGRGRAHGSGYPCAQPRRTVAVLRP